MQSILLEIGIVVVLLLLNGVFAMSEIAVVTSRRTRLEQRAREGSAGARRALALVDDPTRFLSTVQIGITLIGVLAGAYGGATIAAQLDVRLEQIPEVARFSEVIAVGVVVGGIAFLSLVIGELVPKRIAMQAPERIASIVALPMQGIERMAAPAVAVLTFTTTTILRLLRISEARGTRVTEDEIRAMIAEGRQSGAVQVGEHEMLEGVFRLGDRTARDIMESRHDLDWYDLEEGVEGLQARLARPDAEAILVCRGSVDDVVGILRPQRALRAALEGETVDAAALTERALFVPGSLAVLRLIEQLRQSRQRAAVVLDEFGGVEGFVTLDDVVRDVVGEVLEPDEQSEDAPWTERADGSWLVDGATDFAEVAERFALGGLPERERGVYRSLGGFVMARLGRVPRVGEHFTWEEVRFEVVDMDGRRVDKVLAYREPASNGS